MTRLATALLALAALVASLASGDTFDMGEIRDIEDTITFLRSGADGGWILGADVMQVRELKRRDPAKYKHLYTGTGLYVVGVLPGTPMAEAGIHAGCIISRVKSQKIMTIAQLNHLFKAASNTQIDRMPIRYWATELDSSGAIRLLEPIEVDLLPLNAAQIDLCVRHLEKKILKRLAYGPVKVLSADFHLRGDAGGLSTSDSSLVLTLGNLASQAITAIDVEVHGFNDFIEAIGSPEVLESARWIRPYPGKVDLSWDLTGLGGKARFVRFQINRLRFADGKTWTASPGFSPLYEIDTKTHEWHQAGHMPTGEPERKRIGAGVCFAITPDGWLITAGHVVRGAKSISLEIDGRRVSARLVSLREASDLALLRTESATPNYLPIGPILSLGSAADVVTIGYPFLLGLTSGQRSTWAQFNFGSASARSETMQIVDRQRRSACGKWIEAGGPVIHPSSRAVIGVLVGGSDPRAQSSRFVADTSEIHQLARSSGAVLPRGTRPSIEKANRAVYLLRVLR